MFTLKRDEGERRWKKVRSAMEERGLDCLIVWGSFGAFSSLSANLRYLSNVANEGYLVFPLQGEPTLFTFLIKEDQESWISDWRCGHPVYSKAIAERLRELHCEGASIGMVESSEYYTEMGFPYATYMSLVNDFPKAKFEKATDILDRIRMIKSAAEIRCFELGCEVGERVIQAIVDTARAGASRNEIRAKIMDTLLRNGCETYNLLIYGVGTEINHAGQGGHAERGGQKVPEHGDMILAEFDAKYQGYQAQFNQPFVVREPSKEWQRIFDVALESFNNGLKTLRAGITVGEFDEAFLSPIREAGYTYMYPHFHGLGLALEEPIGSFPIQPAYKPNTSFRLEAGMVFEFEPHVVTPDGKKGLSLGCPVVVTETGCRLISKNWQPELKII